MLVFSVCIYVYIYNTCVYMYVLSVCIYIYAHVCVCGLGHGFISCTVTPTSPARVFAAISRLTNWNWHSGDSCVSQGNVAVCWAPILRASSVFMWSSAHPIVVVPEICLCVKAVLGLAVRVDTGRREWGTACWPMHLWVYSQVVSSFSVCLDCERFG